MASKILTPEQWVNTNKHLLPEVKTDILMTGYAQYYHEQMSGWVKIEDGCEMPEHREHVQVWHKYYGTGHAVYDGELKVFAIKNQPSHWAKFPSPPQTK